VGQCEVSHVNLGIYFNGYTLGSNYSYSDNAMEGILQMVVGMLAMLGTIGIIGLIANALHAKSDAEYREYLEELEPVKVPVD
jgi:Ni/Fe-hydrogenase subunit HybB-like protein